MAHHIGSRLEIAGVSEQAVADALARIPAAGIVLEELSANADEASWQRAFGFL